MSGIYLPYQKIPRWNINRAAIAHNCARMELPMPVLTMPFWERAGNKAYNYGRNQNLGVFYNSPTWIMSQQGSGLEFNTAQADEVRVVYNPLFDLTEFTIAAGFRHDTTTNWRSLINKQGGGAASTDRNFFFGISYSDNPPHSKHKLTILWSSGGVGDKGVSGTTNVDDNNYHVGIATCKGGTGKIYLDGKLENTNAGQGTPDTQSEPIHIGAYNNTGSGINWDGEAFWVLVFNRRLTDHQAAILSANSYGILEPIRKSIWIVPIGPTTVSPTTVAPTTLAPTTIAPPTTIVPTTTAPTTIAPTTIAPTTPSPTTIAPTTSAPPTTGAPTPAPTTIAPTTVAPPTTVIPTTAAPTSAPTTVAPTILPTTLAPTTAAPTLAPTTLAPTTVGPTTITLTTITPTTAAPETICVKELNSVITKEFLADSFIAKEMLLRSVITKEIRLYGNLC